MALRCSLSLRLCDCLQAARLSTGTRRLLRVQSRCLSSHAQSQKQLSFSADFLRRLQGETDLGTAERKLEAFLHQHLLTAAMKGEEHPSPEEIAERVCAFYKQQQGGQCREGNEQGRTLLLEGKRLFFNLLADKFGVDHKEIASSVDSLLELHAQGREEATILHSEGHLRKSLKPFYCSLFTHISRLEGGLKFLVDLRGDLLDIMRSPEMKTADMPHFHELDQHLKEFLAQWFSVRFLELHNLTWESPCDIMEKVSRYEAVHPLRHWKDLKHRVGTNRRCFVFIHPAMPREPVVVLHVALTNEPASSVQVLLDRKMEHLPLDEVNSAVFYSISATQKGLAGVELGNFLIKRVVEEVRKELPTLQYYITLSPVPGFRKWLESHVKMLHQSREKTELSLSLTELSDTLHPLFPDCTGPLEPLQAALNDLSWAGSPKGKMAEILRRPLLKLCARYLFQEKRRRLALDPVAHFHLQNGASIWRLNWLGDTSSNGLKRSFGIMTNYLYHLPHLSSNSVQYSMKERIALSEMVEELLHTK